MTLTNEDVPEDLNQYVNWVFNDRANRRIQHHQA
jgi:hypothetical protein